MSDTDTEPADAPADEQPDAEPDAADGDETLREHFEDLEDPQPWSVQQTKRLGARVADIITHQIRTLVTNILLFVTKLLPFSQKFWQGVLATGYKGLLKNSGADAIGHVAEQGRIRHVPVKWDREEGRWITQGENYWNAASEGDNTYLVANKVPAIWAASEANEIGSHVQAEVAEVLDLGGGTNLFTDATVQQFRTYIGGGDALEGGDATVADGGTQAVAEEHISVADPGEFEQQLVSLDRFLSSDENARVVSMNKYYETYPEVVDPEEMQRQEERGYLAGHDPDEFRAFAVKMMLIALGIIAIVILGPPLISALFNNGAGGGGGGASVIPLVLGVV